MAINHPTVKAPGQRIFAIADWNANHAADAVLVPNLNADMCDSQHLGTLNNVQFGSVALVGASTQITLTNGIARTSIRTKAISGNKAVFFPNAAGDVVLTGGTQTISGEKTFSALTTHDNALLMNDNKAIGGGTDGDIGFIFDSVTGNYELVGFVGSPKMDFQVPVMMTALPVADPHVVGELWNNVGIVTVSAG